MNNKAPYSYREDKNVPEFIDTHPIIIFDGICVLCSGGAAKLIEWDKKGLFRFATAQSPLGKSLLEHYDCDNVNFNTILLVANGMSYIKSDAYIETARQLGGAWKIFTFLKFLPKSIRDTVYDFKARNRYKWFGKTEYCKLIPLEMRDRFIQV